MIHNKQRNKEHFNNGVAIVCRTEKRAIVQEVAELRFGVRTIGVTRFYQAKIADVGIDKLISVPVNQFIDTKSILIIKDIQYEVKQIQEKRDTIPPTVYVTLAKATPAYEDRRHNNEDS